MEKKWYWGVKNSDVGNTCKCSSMKGKIIAVDSDGKWCTVKNKNGTIHGQQRSNVMVLR